MNKMNEYLSFEEARDYVRNQNLQNPREWKKWINGKLKDKEEIPSFIPINPDSIYKDCGWLGWLDWIEEYTPNNESLTESNVKYLPFEEAREFIRNLNLGSNEQWINYYQNKINGLIKPENIPWNPNTIYINEWRGIKDWIGTNRKDFNEARKFVRDLGLHGHVEWLLYCKNQLDGYNAKPTDIPAAPEIAYQNNGWIDMSDWLGTERKRKSNYGEVDDIWLSYKDAKKYVHSLKLSSYDEWKAYTGNKIENLPLKPIDLPKSPQYVYKNWQVYWIGWLKLIPNWSQL